MMRTKFRGEWITRVSMAACLVSAVVAAALGNGVKAGAVPLMSAAFIGLSITWLRRQQGDAP